MVEATIDNSRPVILCLVAYYLPGYRSVQVNDVEPRRTHGLPLEGDGHRVVRIDSFLSVISLKEPHAAAAVNVYGRNNLYDTFSDKVIWNGGYYSITGIDEPVVV